MNTNGCRVRRGSAAGFAVTAALVVAACGGPGAGGDSTVTVDTLPSGAVRVAHQPPASGIQPTWVLEEELRIGALDDDGPASFGQIKGLVVDDANRIWVLDARAQELRVFGPAGEHLRTLGRRGEGPGEFGDANGLMRAPDGRIWVVDPRLARMTVVDPDRGIETAHRWDSRSWGFVWDGRFDAEGRVVERTSGQWNGERYHLLRRLDASLAPVDSFPIEPMAEPGADAPGWYRWEAPGMGGYFGVPFYATAQRALDSQARTWQTTDGDPAYRVVRTGPAGDTSLVLESRRPAVPVTAAERDSAMASLRETLQARGSTSRLDASRVPDLRPAVTGLFVTDDDDLWVRVTTPDPDAPTWDIYAPDGEYRGTATTLLRVYRWTPPVVRGDRVWAVVTDELDVQYVVRARLAAAAGAR